VRRRHGEEGGEKEKKKIRIVRGGRTESFEYDHGHLLFVGL
jgi:hypothetical protein